MDGGSRANSFLGTNSFLGANSFSGHTASRGTTAQEASGFSGDDGSGGEQLLRGRQVQEVSAGQQSKSEGQAVIIKGSHRRYHLTKPGGCLRVELFSGRGTTGVEGEGEGPGWMIFGGVTFLRTVT